MKRYKVTGTQRVLERDPGETFEASVDPGLEDFLLGIGALKVLEVEKPKVGKSAHKR